MENIHQILAQFTPKKLEIVLETYVSMWQKQAEDTSLRMPSLGVYLRNGAFLAGEVVQVNFPSDLLGLRVGKEPEELHIHIIPLREIQSFSLHHLEHCAEFVAELGVR
jgi:hypothetical protein